MNYRQVYIRIIKKAFSEKRCKGRGIYYETHHILPKSIFPKWIKRKSNLVLLTAREHFFCHLLLAKIYPSVQMNYALIAFTTRPNSDYKISSREYARIKEMQALYLSDRNKNISTELREQKRKRLIEYNHNRDYDAIKHKLGFCQSHSQETKEKISKSMKGKHNCSQEKLLNGYKNYLKNNRQKQRDNAKNASNFAVEKNSIKVKCIETNEVFNSIKDAKSFLGIKNSITERIKQGKSIRGHHFIFL